MVAKVQPIGRRRRAATAAAAAPSSTPRRSCSPSAASAASPCRRSPTPPETHKTTVLYHFETKEALHEAVLDEALGRLAAVMREFLAGELRRDRARLPARPEPVVLRRAHRTGAAAPARAARSTDVEAYLQRFVEPIYLPALQEHRARHRRRRHPPHRPCASSFTTCTCSSSATSATGRCSSGCAPGDPFSVEALIERRDYLVDQIFRQLAPDPPPRMKERAS